MHRFDESSHVLRWRELVNPMAQVENMSRARRAGIGMRRAKAGEYLLHRRVNLLGVRKQHHRVDVALERFARTALGATH